MASISRVVTAKSGGATASVTITANYTVNSTSPTATTVTSTTLVVGAQTVSGGTSTEQATARSSLTLKLTYAVVLNFGGQSVAGKSGVSYSTTYTFSGSASVAKGHSATTSPLVLSIDGTTTVNISVPVRTSYAVTFNANSGNGAPTNQTKWHDETLTITTAKPTKTDYTCIGWATSTTIASAGTVNYASGATYTANQALNLYAVWKRNYTKPTLDNLHVDRCQQDGSLDDDGGYAKVTFTWGVFRTNDPLYYGGSDTAYSDNAVDSCTIQVGTQSATPTLTGQSGTASVIVGNGTFDTDTAYPATVSITDTQEVVADNTTTITGELSKAKFPIDINRYATAIAFLSTAPDDDEGVFCPDMTAQEVQDFMDNLEGGGGIDFTRIKRELLWTNATSPFASQTVSLALSEYDYVEVWFGSLITVDAMLPNPLLIPLGERREIVVLHALGDGGANENTGMRNVTVTTTGVTFGDYNYKNRRTGGGLTTANQFAVPKKIYGVKYY